jgi:hypothetical protein
MRNRRRLATFFYPTEIVRAERAARIRRLSLAEFIRQSVSTSDETLASPRHESDPFERAPVSSFGVTPSRR